MSDSTVARDTTVPTERFVMVAGHSIRYVEAGEGPPAILIHALGSDLRDWDANLVPIALSGHRTIAYDMLGAGGSGKPDLAYTPETMVRMLEGMMGALGVGRASLVGHSFGGATAAAFAAAHPDSVDRLVLVDAGYAYALPDVRDPADLGHNPGTFRLILPNTPADAHALLQLALADPVKANDPEVVATTLANIIASQPMANRIAESFVARVGTLDNELGNIRAPTLVLWGARDGVTPLSMAMRFVRDIPGARHIVFANSAHSPNNESPTEFNSAVVEFLGPSRLRMKGQAELTSAAGDALAEEGISSIPAPNRE